MGCVEALEQKIQMMDKKLEDKVMNAADPAPSSTTHPNTTPSHFKHALLSWAPLPHTLHITAFAVPFTMGQSIAGLSTDRSIFLTIMLIMGSCSIEFFGTFVLQPRDEKTKTERKTDAEVKKKSTEAAGLGECVNALEGKIDRMNKRLADQVTKASELVPSSTIPRNATSAESQTDLFSTPLGLVLIVTPLMIAFTAYLYITGLIPGGSMLPTIMLSLIPFVTELSTSILGPSGQESRQEMKGTANEKKREAKQEGVVLCAKSLEDKITMAGNALESKMEGMEKRLVKDTEKKKNSLYHCIEDEVDDLKASLEETLTDRISARNDVIRRKLEKKISGIVHGMEGRMRKWSQEKINELNEKVSASLEAKVVEHTEGRNGVSLGMPEQLMVLVEQLELALEGEWQGIGNTKAIGRLEKEIERVILLAWTNEPIDLASDNSTDFEEGSELAVGKKVYGDDAQDTLDETHNRSRERPQEADIHIEEDSDDEWKLIDQI